ncbi:MAG: hypothetical protein WC846_03360 [Candidatus Gracilibacteria bacterium]|jgi:hypothetical protein
MKTFLTILLTAIIVGGPLGVFSYNQYLTINNLKNETASFQEQTNARQGQLIAAKTLSWNGQIFTLEHMCAGTVKISQEKNTGYDNATYCMGNNRLQLSDQNGQITVIDTSDISTDADAPFMESAYLIPSNEEGIVLVSYGSNDCFTIGNCGVGYSPFREFAIKLSDRSSRILENIPTSNETRLVWNSTGTKALAATTTCGGAGCGISPIRGYDLATDTVKTITTEEAAYGDQSHYSSDPKNYFEVDGTILPVWGYLSSSTWTSETEITVTMYLTDGTKKEVSGSF